MTNKTDWLNNTDPEKLFALPTGISYLIQTNHLFLHLENDNLRSRLASYVWWMLQGQLVYKEINWCLRGVEYAYLQNNNIDQALEGNETLLVLWLQSTMDLGFQVSPQFNDKLIQPVKLDDISDELQLPYFIKLIFESRKDLQSIFKLSDLFNYFGLLVWWDGYGQYEYPRLNWSSSTNLLLPLLAQTNFANHYVIPKFLVILFNNRPDLQNVIGDIDRCEAATLVEWWHTYGQLEYAFLKQVNVRQATLNKYEAHVVPTKGLNVIGFAQGVLGLGEDARLVGDCCIENNIPAAMINAPIAGPEKLIDLNPKLELCYYPKYKTSIFCLPPTEMMRLCLEKGRYMIDADTYNIGAWPWELPNWPTTFSKVRNFVDEIWAQSEFVKTCFQRQGNTPVYKMPMAVTLPKVTKTLREQYDLPSGRFLFYLMFDGNSWLSRKNPLAGVQAFQKAFPKHKAENDVGLVIKAMNIQSNDLTWQEILTIAANDMRIKIIKDRLSRQEVVNLMGSCDSYISLHRSEGFGRVIAEAMLLGQPVVATNFSGNLDFCHAHTAFLVDGNLIALKNGDYLFSDNQYWFEPDVDEAAIKLRTIYEDKFMRDNVASNAKRYIETHYSIDTVAKAQMKRLSEIWSRHDS